VYKGFISQLETACIINVLVCQDGRIEISGIFI